LLCGYLIGERKESSFSEEKEAKRLLLLRCGGSGDVARNGNAAEA
jgi:hypothetical protein